MTNRLLLLAVLLAGCGTTSVRSEPAGEIRITPYVGSGSERAVRVTGSYKELEKLKTRYARFQVAFAGVKGAIHPGGGRLDLPWTIVIPRGLPRPIVVRLQGVTAKNEVETVSEVECP